MPFEIAPHTADVRLSVQAGSFRELIADSVAALMAVVEGQGKGEEVTREIEMEARDRTSLLVDFLGEVLALTHINREVYDRVECEILTDNKIMAKLSGFAVNSFGGDVKAVTYHEAEVVMRDDKWSVTLVLDV